LPVSVSLPLPGTIVTSVVSRSPPNIVTASPLPSPISSCFSRRASRYFSMPSHAGSLSGVTSNEVISRLAARYSFAIFRHTVAISRSRLRTPASFV
jgi:hypothetical protein